MDSRERILKPSHSAIMREFRTHAHHAQRKWEEL